MYKIKYRVLALLMCFVMALAGCGGGQEEVEEKPPEDKVKVSDAYFGLAYYQNGPLNPVTNKVNVNRLVCEAMYEGLFEVSSNFTAQNVLCKEYSGDGTEFTFTLKDGVTFWSGEPLTSDDVIASYQAARNDEDSPYHDRLSEVESMETVSDKQLRITLSSPNINFPRLLDIPVFREGSDEEGDFADGTGPYKPVKDGALLSLEANKSWNGGFLGAVRNISLVTIPKSDAAAEAFQTGDVSLLREPRIAPEGKSSRAGASGSTVPVKTSSLHFLGFNYDNEKLSNPKVRQALSAAVPRTGICEVSLQTYADPAVLPVNPQPEIQGLELNMEASTKAAAELIKDAEIEGEINIRLLVNENNAFKCAAAEQIAGAWNAISGVTATLDKESYSYFMSALESKSFDVYYGETQLTPDFDLRPLLSSGGKLNYGGYSSKKTSEAIESARKGEDVSSLYARLMKEMPIIPVAFEKYQVIIRKGVIDNFAPAPYNVFAGQELWTVAAK